MTRAILPLLIQKIIHFTRQCLKVSQEYPTYILKQQIRSYLKLSEDGIQIYRSRICWSVGKPTGKSDHGFPAYDELICRLEKSQEKEIPEALRKKFHVCEDNAEDEGS